MRAQERVCRANDAFEKQTESPSASPLAAAEREATAFCTLAGIPVEPHRVRLGFDLLKAQPTGAMWVKLMLLHIYESVS